MASRGVGLFGVLVAGLMLGFVHPPLDAQTAPTPEERVAALKKSLADSHAQLRRYQWIETTVISLKGEEKTRKQQTVYYGADGTLTKLPIGGAAPPPQASSRGGGRGARLKGAIVENKKEDIQDYMEAAAELIHQYIPPNPVQIQKAKDAGTVTVQPGDQGRVRLAIADYLLPGDRMTVDVNAAANSLAALTVATYLNEKKDEVVALDVRFGALADGTSYTAETTLDAKAKNIRVVIQNAGHKPLAK